MKLGLNIVTECPLCKSTMIIADPIKQDSLSGEHKIEQRCGDCKRIVVMWLSIAVKMWEVKS